MTDTTTELAPLSLPRTAHPLGLPATVLRAKHASKGTLSDADEFVITAITAEDGKLTELPRAARARRLDPGQPEAWLFLCDVFGRTTWAIVPAMPAGHRRDEAAVRRYLNGWMASGNYAHLQDSRSVVEFYGAVAIHDRREWPPALPGTEAAAGRKNNVTFSPPGVPVAEASTAPAAERRVSLADFGTTIDALDRDGEPEHAVTLGHAYKIPGHGWHVRAGQRIHHASGLTKKDARTLLRTWAQQALTPDAETTAPDSP